MRPPNASNNPKKSNNKSTVMKIFIIFLENSSENVGTAFKDRYHSRQAPNP